MVYTFTSVEYSSFNIPIADPYELAFASHLVNYLIVCSSTIVEMPHTGPLLMFTIGSGQLTTLKTASY